MTENVFEMNNGFRTCNQLKCCLYKLNISGLSPKHRLPAEKPFQETKGHFKIH